MGASQGVYSQVAIHGTTGNIAVVTGVAGKKVHLHGFVLTSDTGTNATLRWEDGNGGTALTGQMQIGSGTAGDAAAPIVAPFSPVPWCSTTAGNTLNLEVTGAARGVAIVRIETA